MGTILIVEDDADLCEVYRDILESEGHNIDIINSASKAVDYLIRQRNRPDVVLLDMQLPGDSGLIVLGFIRRLPRLAKTKVVIASGYPDLAKQAVEQWGADLFLRKPVPFDTLTTTIDQCITAGRPC
ncbi:MAG: response regulator [Anaerolineae bacterium]|nr:response regulator [Anaerolineae bacterium]